MHTMRNPTTETDVAAWQDHFDCSEGCGASFVDIALPSHPWGEVDIDAGVTVYPGVSHYELGVTHRRPSGRRCSGPSRRPVAAPAGG